jgi:hypothetical protein
MQFPAALTVRLENVGHYLGEDAPDDVSGWIRTWWREIVEPG